MTTTAVETLKVALDDANPNKIADALHQVALGSILDPVQPGEVTLAVVADTITLDPPALVVLTCRVTDVTAGTGALGSRIMVDAAGTATAPTAPTNPGIAVLAADGSTIKFEGTVKKYIVTYLARSATDLGADFKRA